jgi:hypothetical protein
MFLWIMRCPGWSKPVRISWGCFFTCTHGIHTSLLLSNGYQRYLQVTAFLILFSTQYRIAFSGWILNIYNVYLVIVSFLVHILYLIYR